jgi:hypothetical protein
VRNRIGERDMPMKANSEAAGAGTSDVAPLRRAYVTPALVRYGTLVELTRDNSPTNEEDGYGTTS